MFFQNKSNNGGPPFSFNFGGNDEPKDFLNPNTAGSFQDLSQKTRVPKQNRFKFGDSLPSFSPPSFGQSTGFNSGSTGFSSSNNNSFRFKPKFDLPFNLGANEKTKSGNLGGLSSSTLKGLSGLFGQNSSSPLDDISSTAKGFGTNLKNTDFLFEGSSKANSPISFNLPKLKAGNIPDLPSGNLDLPGTNFGLGAKLPTFNPLDLTNLDLREQNIQETDFSNIKQSVEDGFSTKNALFIPDEDSQNRDLDSNASFNSSFDQKLKELASNGDIEGLKAMKEGIINFPGASQAFKDKNISKIDNLINNLENGVDTASSNGNLNIPKFRTIGFSEQDQTPKPIDSPSNNEDSNTKLLERRMEEVIRDDVEQLDNLKQVLKQNGVSDENLSVMERVLENKDTINKSLDELGRKDLNSAIKILEKLSATKGIPDDNKALINKKLKEFKKATGDPKYAINRPQHQLRTKEEKEKVFPLFPKKKSKATVGDIIFSSSLDLADGSITALDKTLGVLETPGKIANIVFGEEFEKHNIFNNFIKEFRDDYIIPSKDAISKIQGPIKEEMKENGFLGSLLEAQSFIFKTLPQIPQELVLDKVNFITKDLMLDSAQIYSKTYKKILKSRETKNGKIGQEDKEFARIGARRAMILSLGPKIINNRLGKLLFKGNPAGLKKFKQDITKFTTLDQLTGFLQENLIKAAERKSGVNSKTGENQNSNFWENLFKTGFKSLFGIASDWKTNTLGTESPSPPPKNTRGNRQKVSFRSLVNQTQNQTSYKIPGSSFSQVRLASFSPSYTMAQRENDRISQVTNQENEIGKGKSSAKRRASMISRNARNQIRQDKNQTNELIDQFNRVFKNGGVTV